MEENCKLTCSTYSRLVVQESVIARLILSIFSVLEYKRFGSEAAVKHDRKLREWELLKLIDISKREIL